MRRIKLFALSLVIILFISGCVQKEKDLTEAFGTELPPSKFIENLIPPLNYPWKLLKSDEGSTLSISSEIPRVPKVIFKKNVSANIGGILATPLVEDNKIFLADHLGIYALNESNGELLWGVEVCFDTLDFRKISDPQPVEKWRALNLFRFVESYGLGKYLFVGTSSTPEDSGYLLAFNKSTGDLVWEAKLDGGKNSHLSVTSNLIVAGGEVCAGSRDGYIFCFTEEGEFLWRTKIDGNVRGLAYGNGLLFVTSEQSKSIHAFDIKTGKEVWSYSHNDMVNTPVYKENKIFFIDSSGHLVALSSKGEKIFEKGIFGGSDVNTNSYLAIGKLLYAPRSLGEKPLDFYVIDFDGNIIGEFKLEKGERAGAPVVTKNIILLPVVGDNYAKVYFLWKGINKLYEFELSEDGGLYMPKVSAAYGNIYIAISPRTLIKFGDYESPKIIKIEEEEENKNINVKALIQDAQSGIYKAFVAYKDGEKWYYVEMELEKKHVIEPIGGHGFNEEEYVATIPDREYVIIAIDNVGNYNFSQD